MTDTPELPGNEVHLWLTTLAVEQEELVHLTGLLSPDESARAGRLLDRQARDRFIAGRGLLRTILGRYRKIPPAEVRFAYGEHGKPSLAGEPLHGLSFNLSHAGDLLLLAIGRGRDMGIDLEQVQENVPFREMAARYFAPRERAELFSLPPEAQLAAFYRCWTRKEAYLKGCGSGFTQPSGSFGVSLLTDHPPALVEHRASPYDSSQWHIRDVAVPPGYCAALAVTGELPGLRALSWTYAAHDLIFG
jgi:4'-phosphopantetheinyl transferase